MPSGYYAKGETINRKVTISVYASDSSGTSKVEIYVDGKLPTTLTSNPYNISWNTKNVKDCSHTITAKA